MHIKPIELLIKNKKYFLVEIPNKKYREHLGIFCKDDEVNYGLTELGLYGEESRKPFINFNNGKIIFNIELPMGRYVILDRLRDLSEKEAIKLVHKEKIKDITFYKDYDISEKLLESKPKLVQLLARLLPTARESFFSLLKSKKIKSKSFIQEPKILRIEFFPINNILEEKFADEHNTWEKLPDDFILIKKIS